MSTAKGMVVVCVVCLSTLGLASLMAPRALTQNPSPSVPGDSERTLQALLGEVRELRLAIQRSNVNAYHAQITLERVRTQQQRVDRLNAQLGEVRNHLAQTKREAARLTEQLKDVEGKLAQDVDAGMRAQREDISKALKYELEERAQREQEQAQLEAQLTGQLQAEQARLNELNERLDALQRELEVRPSPDQPGGKRH